MYTPKQILKTYYGYDSFRPLQEGIICHVLQRKDAQCAFPPILTEIKKPSGSQRTVMYISVLFAISDFTQQKREEDYPLIFDAATSSFGDSKEGEFYNVISNVKKQCIIVTKDFITKGEVAGMIYKGWNVLCIASRKLKASTQIIWQPFVQL